MTLQDLVNLVEEADHLVRPFLLPGDTWRHDRDGVPEIDDMMVALQRVTGRKSVRLDVSYRGYEFVVGWHGRAEDFIEGTFPEALLAMLADEFRRTCAACREFDGHEASCPIHLAELAEEVA